MIQNNINLLSIVSLIALCTQAYSDPYHDNNHPVLARIVKRNGDECTGAYIEEGFIVTSGACANKVGKHDKVILKDDSLQQDPLPSYDVIKSFTHPKFIPTTMKVKSNYDGHLIPVIRGKSYDLGLVQIDFHQNPPNDRKLTIAGLNEHDAIKTQLEAILWNIEDVLSPTPKLANYTDYSSFEIISNDNCGVLEKSLDRQPAFCAGYENDDGALSYYEYGSPVVFHDNKSTVLVGVFSKNQPEKGASNPSVVTKVAPFKPWINKIIEANRLGGHSKVDSKKNRHPKKILDNTTGPKEWKSQSNLETNEV